MNFKGMDKAVRHFGAGDIQDIFPSKVHVHTVFECFLKKLSLLFTILLHLVFELFHLLVLLRFVRSALYI